MNSSNDRKPDDNIVSLPSAEGIEADAAAWLTVLGREEVSERDRAEFERWLGASDRHRATFRELSELWGELALLKELDDIAESMEDETPPRRPIFRRRSFIAAAASLALVVAGGTVIYALQQARHNQHEIFATSVGEQRTIRLVDGSRLQLNTDSRVEVTFTSAKRSVRLVAGEAYFSVETDRRRPFTVHAAGGVVKAVGTAFTVRLRDNDAVEVTVEEGQVAITSLVADTSGARTGRPVEAVRTPLAQLTAGQSVIFGERVEEIEQMEAPELQRKLSWRQGMLVYSGERLADVIADVSRYTNVVIEISDPTLSDKPVAGFFRVGEVEALFDSLELSFGLHVEHVDDKYIILPERS